MKPSAARRIMIEEFPDGINPDLLIPKRNSPPEMLFNPRFADLFTVASEMFKASAPASIDIPADPIRGTMNYRYYPCGCTAMGITESLPENCLDHPDFPFV